MTPLCAGSESRELSRWETRRLWSLRDMFELKAGAFYEAATHLSSVSTYIGAITARSSEKKDEEKRPIFHEENELDEVGRTYMKMRLEDLQGHLGTLGARVTVLATEELLESIGHGWTKWGNVKDKIEEIRN